MSDLILDWCSHEAATFAVTKWHYSRTMPSSKLVRIGVWEEGRFVGAILYGCGANRHLSRPFDLEPTEACELVRVALASGCQHPTSQCLGRSLKLLKAQSPGLRLIVSYADSGQGHRGTIYQATNWLYLGETNQSYLRVKRRLVHPRSLYDRYGPGGQSLDWLREHVDPRAERVQMPPKHKYVFPLDRKIRRTLRQQALPYPRPDHEPAM